MKKTIRYTISTLCACSLLLSCSRAEMPETDRTMHPDLSAPITLGSSISGSLTKGQPPLDNVNIIETDIGLFAGFNVPDEPFSDTTFGNGVMSNVKFSRNATDGKWHGSTACYWPVTGSLSLFAYAPYQEDLQVSPSYAGGPLSILFSPSQSSVTYQRDFCVAAPVYNQTKTSDAVSMSFHHTLCQIFFFASYTGTPLNDCVLVIDEITLGGVAGTNTLTYGAQGSSSEVFTWADVSTQPRTASYTILSNELQCSPTNPVPKYDEAKEVSDRDISITGINGRMFLIPQTLTEDNSLSITWSFMRKNGNQWQRVSQFLTETKLPYTGDAPVWEAGKTMEYHMRLNLGAFADVTVSANVTDWLSAGNPGNDRTHNIID